jgi:hypothetical protein
MTPEMDLLYAVIIRAYRDVVTPPKREPERRGDALRFLREEGAEIIEALGITTAERVRKWAADPHEPEGLTVDDLAKRAEIDKAMVKRAITNGELDAFVPHGAAYGHRIREQDAAAWLSYRRIYP